MDNWADYDASQVHKSSDTKLVLFMKKYDLNFTLKNELFLICSN